MKKTYLNILWAMLTLFVVSACTEEDYGDASKSGLAVLDESNFSVIADQETNTVTFEYTGVASYPIWILDDGTTKNNVKFSKVYAKQGTYSVECKVANKNGISDGSVMKSFTIEQTMIDEAKIKALCGSLTGTRTWVWNSASNGHFGCGDGPTNATGWWSCNANEKADWGIYDDSFTFSADGTYVYNPGAGGTIYCNKDVAKYSSYYLGDGNDYMAPVQEQTATWELSYEGDDLYLVFPAGTMVGYIPSDEVLNNPKFLILSVSSTKLCMATVGTGISWYYEFIPEELVGSDIVEPSASTIAGTWMWDYTTDGHFGCGETSDNPTGWWSCSANEKADWGLYDDILTFDADGNYTFNPGEGGMIYVNKDCSFHSELYLGDNNDYMAPADVQTTTYEIVQEDGAYYLQFPANTIVSYMPSDEVYNNPKYLITNFTKDTLEFSSLGTGISWRYRFKRVVE